MSNPNSGTGNGLIAAGFLSMMAGGIMIAVALTLQTGVEIGAGEVVDNFRLMHRQMMTLHIGLALALAGVIGLGCGHIVRAINGR